jgi:hypothetical protein
LQIVNNINPKNKKGIKEIKQNTCGKLIFGGPVLRNLSKGKFFIA